MGMHPVCSYSSDIPASGTNVASAGNSKGLSAKDFKLGMSRNDIPAIIKLVNGRKGSSYDNSYYYHDGNNNIIDINGFKFNISFEIRGDNNTVKGITYTAHNVGKINDDTLLGIAKYLTVKPLKIRKLDIATIFEYTEMFNGFEERFQATYLNENSSPDKTKNSIDIMLLLEDKQKSDIENQKIVDRTLDQSFVTIKRGIILCRSDTSLKKVFDIADGRSNDNIPSDCFKVEEGKFLKG